MKISYNGQEIEAYSLVMTKENALAILNGKKDIETRMLSTKYEKMFTDFAQVDENEKLRKSGHEDECKPVLRTDIEVKVRTECLPSSTADVMLDTTFDSVESLKGYAVHPKHVAVADSKVRPYTAVRSCMDYEI